MFVRLLSCLLATCATAALAISNPTPDAPLSRDPRLLSGVLPNGVRYQVQRHAVPSKKVELRLVVAAGSMLEGETQQGYAHLLEHLAFRRTARFSGQDVMAFIEAAGMRIGADSNAYTSYNETVYQLALPTDRPDTVTRGVQLLADWAHGIRFDPDEVVKESHIVTEEWRLSERRRAQRQPFDDQLYADSRYLKRPPIGRMDQVARADIKELESFYQRWYRPDRMTVIAVGDIDPAAMEALIKHELGAIPAAADPQPVVIDPVPPKSGLRVVSFKDDEGGARVRLSWPGEREYSRTQADYRASSLRYLASRLLVERLREIASRPNQAIYTAFYRRGMMPDRRALRSFVVVPNSFHLKATWEQLQTEIERAARYGFTEQEFRRLRADTLVTMQRRLDQDEAQPAEQVAASLVDAAIDDETPQAPADELKQIQDVLRDDVLPEVNATFRRMAQAPDQLLSLELPANKQYDAPTEADVRRIVANVAAAKLEPFQPAPDRALDATPPKPGKVVAEAVNPANGLVTWKLSNGVEMYVLPSRYRPQEVLFEAAGAGGTSALPKTMYAAATITSSVLNDSGVADLTDAQLERVLAGHSAELSVYADTYRHGLRGSARVDDLSTLLALVRLRLTQPRIEEDELDDWIAQRLGNQRRLKERSGDKLRQDMSEKIWGDTFYKRPADPAQLRELDKDSIKHVERRWFGHPARLKFVLVGDVDPQRLKPLVETWIASLPVPDTAFDWATPPVIKPAGGVREVIQHSEDSQKLASSTRSETTLYLRAPAAVDEHEQCLRGLFADVLQRRLSKALREDAALTYHVSVWTGLQRHEGFAANIDFASDHVNATLALNVATGILRDLRENGVTQAEMEDARYRQLLLLSEAAQMNDVLREHIVQAITENRPVQTEAEVRATFQSLTRDELNRRIRGWLAESGLSVAQLNPREGGG